MKAYIILSLFLLNTALCSSHINAQSNDAEGRYITAIETLEQIIEDQNNPDWGLLELRKDDGSIGSYELGTYTRDYGLGSHEKNLQFSKLNVFVRSTQNNKYYFRFFVEIPIPKIYSIKEVNRSEFYIFTKDNDVEVDHKLVRYQDEEIVYRTVESSKHKQDRLRIRVPSWKHDEVKNLLEYIAQYNQERDNAEAMEEMWGGDGW